MKFRSRTYLIITALIALFIFWLQPEKSTIETSTWITFNLYGKVKETSIERVFRPRFGVYQICIISCNRISRSSTNSAYSLAIKWEKEYSRIGGPNE